jgi:hypothetical protein
MGPAKRPVNRGRSYETDIDRRTGVDLLHLIAAHPSSAGVGDH